MAHFAKVNQGIVTNVIVAEPEFFENFVDETPGDWIQTSFNTYGGVHYTQNEDGSRGEPSEDQSKALRYNYGSVGMLYNSEADAFHHPAPTWSSWALNTETYIWEAPIAYPTDGQQYDWDEELYQSDNTQGWVLRETE